MMHIRVVTPPEIRPALLSHLEDEPAVHNLVVFPGAARRPDGDLVQFDIAREGANQVISTLRSLDLHRVGSITIERIDMALSNVAEIAETLAPGQSSEAVVWEEVESRLRDESALTSSYVLMLSIAILIGAIGILLDSPVLIVGAMVVGPDYGPLAAVMYSIHRRRYDRARKALRTLTVGFFTGIFATMALAAVVRVADRIPGSYLADQRPLTSFIAQPDGWSILVALLAGVAGMLAITEAKSGTLVGVLISVTTVPAASNVGVATAMGRWSEATGALAQLAMNIVVLCVAGLMTLAVEQRLTRVPLRNRAGR
jgi:uncharacterized hydrophobic protein (TIGR00271 family)